MANVVIRDLDEDLIAELKTETGHATNSKALVSAASHWLIVRSDLYDARRRIADLENENMRLRSVLDDARSAAASLVEIAGQGDLLSVD